MRRQLWIALPCVLAVACQTSYSLTKDPQLEPEDTQTPDDAFAVDVVTRGEPPLSPVDPDPMITAVPDPEVVEMGQPTSAVPNTDPNAPAPLGSECDGVGAYDWAPQTAEETCYELLTHDQSSPADTSKLVVLSNESVSQLYYDVPWPEGSVATRVGSAIDNTQVVMEWRAFGTDEMQADGTVSKNVTGTTLGTNAKLFARWSAGDCNTVLPDDVGLELPPPRRKLMIQWLHVNASGVDQLDGSKVLVCTVPASSRAHVASYTVLGTEDLNGPIGMGVGIESTFEGVCANQSPVPITILGLSPHMHAIGTHARLELLRADGTTESLFDRPFDSDAEVHYALTPRAQVLPGERLRAECTYFNDYTYQVTFGVSRFMETCEQVALAYPAGALDKPNNATLIGSTNTCWGD